MAVLKACKVTPFPNQPEKRLLMPRILRQKPPGGKTIAKGKPRIRITRSPWKAPDLRNILLTTFFPYISHKVSPLSSIFTFAKKRNESFLQLKQPSRCLDQQKPGSWNWWGRWK